jgi:hypothetical protein
VAKVGEVLGIVVSVHEGCRSTPVKVFIRTTA